MSVNAITGFFCQRLESLRACGQKLRATHECVQCEQSTVIIGNRVAQEVYLLLLLIFPNEPDPASRGALV